MRTLPFFPTFRALLTLVVSVMFLISPVATGVASADPGAPTHTIIVRKVTHLPGSGSHGRPGAGVTPEATTTTDLGGVTAYSIGGLQWREGVFLVDSSGLTESLTSSAIDQLETHGALIHSYSSGNCYDGDYLYIVPSTHAYNSTVDDPGWTPFQTSTRTNCIMMATGHFYIYNGNRTDVSGPDVSKVY